MNPLLLSKLLSMSSSPLSRALPYITAYLPSSLSSFSTLSAYYSQASPFISTLVPSDYGVGFITKFASNVTPFLSDAGSHLYNFIGTITTFFGGPGVVLAIIGATSITTTAIYFFWPDENGFTNWDRRDELTWEDYSKLALYVLAANVATLSCGVLAIHSYGLLMAYLEPADEPVVEEPDKEGVPISKDPSKTVVKDEKKEETKDEKRARKAEKQARRDALELEKLKITTAAQVEMAKAMQPPPQEPSIFDNALKVAGTVGSGVATLAIANPLIAGGIVATTAVVGAGVYYREAITEGIAQASGKVGEALETVDKKTKEAAEYVSSIPEKMVSGVVETVNDAIYGSFEERLDICIDILKKLDDTRPLTRGAMQRMINAIPIDIDLNTPDLAKELGAKIKAHYTSGDPVELFLGDITKKLSANLEKHHSGTALPKELNPLEIYEAMVYPTRIVENTIENAVDAVISTPINIVSGAVDVIAHEVRKSQESMRIAEGIRNGTIATSVHLATGAEINAYGQVIRITKPHVSVRYSDEAKHDLLEEQFSALKQDNNMRTLLIE